MSDFSKELEQDIAKSVAYRNVLLAKGDTLDEDGYPTEDCLSIIRWWHWSDSKGFFAFIKENWWYANIRWFETAKTSITGKPVTEYSISTSGWSGNESIIEAMQDNPMLWSTTWVQSRRGGHYIFEDREFT